jgi:hypothetical protein
MVDLVDQRSYDLAVHFLSDEEPPPDEARLMSLAKAIQQAVEDWMESNP